MKKIIVFNKQAQEKLLAGVNTLADAVLSTLGPKANNVIISKVNENPIVTHDGVTVAREISLSDPCEDAGAKLVLQAASKTNDIAGDGTTTATAVTRAIVREGFKVTDNGYNAQILNTELNAAADLVNIALNKLVKKVETPEQLQQIATISCADKSIGELVAKAVEDAGTYGVVSLNEVPSADVTMEHTTGLEFDRPWISQYFVTDDKNRAAIADPYILITDQKISSMQDIEPFIELVIKNSKNMVIIADDIDGEALSLLVLNKLKGNFNSLAVQAPSFGTRRRQILEDIAVLTGGTFISETAGRTVQELSLSDLGRADRIISTKNKTTIVNGRGSKQAIDNRVSLIKNELEDATNEYDREQTKSRLAKLTSGVVVINVGGNSEAEMNQRKYRIEDAVNATQAARSQGVVVGGEMALLKASKALEGRTDMGSVLLMKALQDPFNVLMSNSGITDGELIAKAIKSTTATSGINVMTGKLTNLIAEGVIDPVLVTRCALKHAVSVAGMILTTKTLVVDVPEEVNNA